MGSPTCCYDTTPLPPLPPGTTPPGPNSSWALLLDTPPKARAAARELDRRYFCGITDEMRAADRKALCSVDAALLKAQAAALSDVLSGGVRVAFGSKDAVEAAKDLFDRVETL